MAHIDCMEIVKTMTYNIENLLTPVIKKIKNNNRYEKHEILP